LNPSLLKLDTEIATSVAWSSDSQLLSASDDKLIQKWSSDAEKIGTINGINVFVTSIAWFPSTAKQVFS
jgi:WD40 repeat protein